MEGSNYEFSSIHVLIIVSFLLSLDACAGKIDNSKVYKPFLQPVYEHIAISLYSRMTLDDLLAEVYY